MNGVGQTIRKLRKQRKMNITQMGRTVGVSGSYIAKLETGERRLSLDLLGKISKALAVNPTDIIGAGESRRPEFLQEIPVLNLASIKSTGQENWKNESDFRVSLPCQSPLPFGIRLEQDCNGSWAKPGDILIFTGETRTYPNTNKNGNGKSTRPIRTGDCVLVKRADALELGEVVDHTVDGSMRIKSYLSPTPSWKDMKTGDFSVIGKLISKVNSFESAQ